MLGLKLNKVSKRGPWCTRGVTYFVSWRLWGYIIRRAQAYHVCWQFLWKINVLEIYGKVDAIRQVKCQPGLRCYVSCLHLVSVAVWWDRLWCVIWSFVLCIDMSCRESLCGRHLDTCRFIMMTSSNGNIFRVTGLWGESTGDWWIALTKDSRAGLWCFPWSVPEKKVAQIIETPVIWDAKALIVTSL